MKDTNILSDWCLEALIIAQERKFDRSLKLDGLIEVFMDDNYMFSTTDEEREQVVEWITDFIIRMHFVCKLIDEGKIKKIDFTAFGKVIDW